MKNNKAKNIVDYICRYLAKTSITNNIEISLSAAKRRQIFGSLDTSLAKQFYYKSRLQAATYFNDYRKTGRPNRCKKTSLPIQDFYLFFLLANKDERVKFKKGEFIIQSKITESVEQIKDIIAEYIYNHFKEELDSKEFKYRETKCGRKYHPLQNVAKSIRTRVFKKAGFKHDYDIESALPTILSQKAGIVWDTNTVSKISEESNVSRKVVKKLINSLFNKGRLSVYAKVLKDFDYITRKRVLNKIKNSPTFIEALSKIEQINNKNLDYFHIEREITELFEQFCKTKNIGIFTIHDGFITDSEISVKELCYYIKQETGFDINIKHQIL